MYICYQSKKSEVHVAYVLYTFTISPPSLTYFHVLPTSHIKSRKHSREQIYEQRITNFQADYFPSYSFFFSFCFRIEQFLFIRSNFTLVFTVYSQNQRNFPIKPDFFLSRFNFRQVLQQLYVVRDAKIYLQKENKH
jgi:hypothetical protein